MIPDSDKFDFLKLSDGEKVESNNNIKKLMGDVLPIAILRTHNKDFVQDCNINYLIKPICAFNLDRIIHKYMK